MEKFSLLILLFFSSSAFAETSRSPAVLSGSCHLDILTTMTVREKGKSVEKERPIQEVQDEQCKEVKKCLNSASDEEVEELRKLEAVACKNILVPITTKTPSTIVEQNYDGKRNAKSAGDSDKITKPLESTSTAR